jgi:hemoglobin-like flavoprotein
MTPEQLALVRQTAALVEQAGDAFADRYYDLLFEYQPSARSLFPADPKFQRGRVVEEIVFLANAAGDLPPFCERARELGRRLGALGVQADDYAPMGEALVAAVADIAGAAWSPEADAAWRCLYALTSETMLEGASGGLFTEPG